MHSADVVELKRDGRDGRVISSQVRDHSLVPRKVKFVHTLPWIGIARQLLFLFLQVGCLLGLVLLEIIVRWTPTWFDIARQLLFLLLGVPTWIGIGLGNYCSCRIQIWIGLLRQCCAWWGTHLDWSC